ncbi:MAG: MATE family efflux transporter [Lachnospiraceae bacterium]|nr:MATE family efflux transporter [Lachnospiraceae bacterium]
MLSRGNKETTARDMTEGPIAKELLLFALPLMIGNVFQMLYNTMDSIVVGNFVSTQALAAVGATTMVTNMAVFFFNGFSIGASVVIGNLFGAKQKEDLQRAVETTMAVTFVMCVLFTIAGVAGVHAILKFMATPDDVMKDASTYLRIYFAGVTGLLIYNMGSGILRAVGDTVRPLYFLIFTSLLNIVLDLLFVVVFHMGIAGAAYATILSQGISALMILRLLTHTKDIYQFTFRDLQMDKELLQKILTIGFPAGIQSIITAFSNVFVQSYINYFGSTVMAAWATYNKLDQFPMLVIQSLAMASTTFVSQNIGARKTDRANRGTKICLVLTLLVTGLIDTIIFVFAPFATRLFTTDQEVIRVGTTLVHVILYFTLFNGINHVLAGALRGRGDSTGPMVIMLLCFVALRQTYLFVVTRFIINIPVVVAFGYPVGWMSCCITETIYFFLRWNRKEKATLAS